MGVSKKRTNVNLGGAAANVRRILSVYFRVLFILKNATLRKRKKVTESGKASAAASVTGIVR